LPHFPNFSTDLCEIQRRCSHLIPCSHAEFRKNWLCGSHALFKAVNKTIFYISVRLFKIFGTHVHKFWVDLSFVKISAVRTILYSAASINSYPCFHIYCPIWAKFGVSELNVTLSSICEFGAYRLSKDRTFLTAIYGVKPHDTLKLVNALVKS